MMDSSLGIGLQATPHFTIVTHAHTGPRSIEEKRIRDGSASYLDWDDTNEVAAANQSVSEDDKLK